MNRARALLRYRRFVIIFAHLVLFVSAYFWAFLLRFDFSIPANELPGLYKALPWMVVIKVCFFLYFGLFRGLWQYIILGDLTRIIKANVFASLTFLIAMWLVVGLYSFPRTVFILDFILCLGLTAALRLLFKFLKQLFDRRDASLVDHNILIVGAGDSGVILLQETLRNPGMGEVIGFIDDDRKKFSEAIGGVKILGRREDIPRVVLENEVDEIILSIPSASGKVVRDILSYCEQTKAKIKVVPGLSQILSGKMEVKPRDVKPEDLLGRETVTIDTDEVAQYIKDKVVLVTGAGGSIGSEVCRQVAAFGPKELILFDHHENFVYFLTIEFKTKFPQLNVRTVIGDIRDVSLLINIFTSCHPQVVFHAAAYKHVPLMEDSPAAAVKNNIFGTRNMIYACHHYHVERFLQISTDKAVNPINAMGMSKRIAEMVLQSKAVQSRTKFMAVRFGNVLGSAGSVVPLFKRQIESGGPITVTHPDVKRYFMSIKEAAMLVLQAGALGKGGELFILDMGEQIKIIELAKNLVALSGLTLGKDIEIKFTGLRPGEKLEEELLLDKEQDAVTRHNKIFVSHDSVDFERKQFNQSLKRLYRLAQAGDEQAVVALMREIISSGNTHSPEFK